MTALLMTIRNVIIGFCSVWLTLFLGLFVWALLQPYGPPKKVHAVQQETLSHSFYDYETVVRGK